MTEHERIMRVPLSLDLIRRMDKLLVQGAGGYQTRADFIRDAIEAYVLELTYGPAPEEPTVGPAGPADHDLPRVQAPRNKHDAAPSGSGTAEYPDLAMTTLLAPDGISTLNDGVALVKDESLFGLHNRDYPSVWAAFKLADMTSAGPVPADDFFVAATEEAWSFAAKLASLQKPHQPKLTALFPTNRDKPQSAEDGFRMFAIGGFSVEEDGGVRAWGPLFAWRVCQVWRENKQLLIGLTEEGARLIRALDGLSLSLPHPAPLAETFFEHLKTFASADWWGFMKVLRVVQPGISRADLIHSFKSDRPDWTVNEASTNTAGYIARAREWGLVEPSQTDRRYTLTPFGKEKLDKTEGSQ